MAERQLQEIKHHLQNPILLDLFPDVLWANPTKDAERWSSSEIIVRRSRGPKEPTISIIGAEGAVAGMHYEHGSFDDLVDEQNSITKDQLEKVIDWYKSAQSLFEPNATQELVATPWAFGDLSDWLIQQTVKRNFRLGVYRQPCWKTTRPGALLLDGRGGIAEDEYVRDQAGRLMPVFPEKHSRESLEELHR